VHVLVYNPQTEGLYSLTVMPLLPSAVCAAYFLIVNISSLTHIETVSENYEIIP
jgi:hypothetical protein